MPEIGLLDGVEQPEAHLEAPVRPRRHRADHQRVGAARAPLGVVDLRRLGRQRHDARVHERGTGRCAPRSARTMASHASGPARPRPRKGTIAIGTGCAPAPVISMVSAARAAAAAYCESQAEQRSARSAAPMQSTWGLWTEYMQVRARQSLLIRPEFEMEVSETGERGGIGGNRQRLRLQNCAFDRVVVSGPPLLLRSFTLSTSPPGSRRHRTRPRGCREAPAGTTKLPDARPEAARIASESSAAFDWAVARRLLLAPRLRRRDLPHVALADLFEPLLLFEAACSRFCFSAFFCSSGGSGLPLLLSSIFFCSSFGFSSFSFSSFSLSAMSGFGGSISFGAGLGSGFGSTLGGGGGGFDFDPGRRRGCRRFWAGAAGRSFQSSTVTVPGAASASVTPKTSSARNSSMRPRRESAEESAAWVPCAVLERLRHCLRLGPAARPASPGCAAARP